MSLRHQGQERSFLQIYNSRNLKCLLDRQGIATEPFIYNSRNLKCLLDKENGNNHSKHLQ